MQFFKYHGLGNDFVILDLRRDTVRIDAQTAIAICDRHRGVGADGVLSVLPPQSSAEITMHIFNADGSEAEMCGNGLRCVVRFVRGDDPRQLDVDTAAGLRSGWLCDDGRVRVTLGAPEDLGAKRVTVDGTEFEGQVVSMGNPHFVLRPFGPDVDLYALAKSLGPRIQALPDFPESTNVEFVRCPAEGIVDTVVYERGAGLTQACGTGAGAVFSALRTWRLRADSARVQLPGGPLEVSGNDGVISITGEAIEVFTGELSTLFLSR